MNPSHDLPRPRLVPRRSHNQRRTTATITVLKEDTCANNTEVGAILAAVALAAGGGLAGASTVPGQGACGHGACGHGACGHGASGHGASGHGTCGHGTCGHRRGRRCRTRLARP